MSPVQKYLSFQVIHKLNLLYKLIWRAFCLLLLKKIVQNFLSSNEQKVTSNQQKVMSNKQRAKSKQQKVTSNDQKVTSNEPTSEK